MGGHLYHNIVNLLMNEQIITFNEIFSPKGGIFPNLRTSPQKLSINLGDIPKGIKHNLSSIQ